jgi:hypothetical protein
MDIPLQGENARKTQAFAEIHLTGSKDDYLPERRLRVAQQLREAFPYDSAPRYLMFDRNATFDTEVIETSMTVGVNHVRTAFKSPWQNGVAGRFVGSCRRDLFDHVIVLNGRHLKWLMNDYACHCPNDRKHPRMSKQTPAGRKPAAITAMSTKIISVPRLGGLHRRYDLAP